MNKFLIRFVVTAVGSLGVLSDAAAAKSGPLACDFSKIEGPILTGSMPWPERQNVTVRVPQAYFYGPIYPSDGQIGNQGTLLMKMQIERFTPYPVEEMTGKIAKGLDDWIQILISPVDSFEDIAQWSAEFNAMKPHGTKFALVKEYNGLLRYDYSPVILGQQVYIAKAGDEITDIISCSISNPKSYKIYPNCNHISTASGLDMQITYPRRELKNWFLIKERAQAFIACLIVK